MEMPLGEVVVGSGRLAEDVNEGLLCRIALSLLSKPNSRRDLSGCGDAEWFDMEDLASRRDFALPSLKISASISSRSAA